MKNKKLNFLIIISIIIIVLISASVFFGFLNFAFKQQLKESNVVIENNNEKQEQLMDLNKSQNNNRLSDFTDSNKVVLIEEYSNFNCLYTKSIQPILKKLKNIYGNKIKIVYKHFPLTYLKNSKIVSEASECARDQGKFWEYHDILYKNQGFFDVNSLKSFARNLDLNTSKFDSCLDLQEKKSIVENDFKEGLKKGVISTPSFFIENEMVSGAQKIERFQEIIEKHLNNSK